MTQFLRLLRGFLTYASGFAGLALATFLYCSDRDPSWEMRVLTSASLGVAGTVAMLFMAIKVHELEQLLSRPRARARHRAGVIDWGGAELPSLR